MSHRAAPRTGRQGRHGIQQSIPMHHIGRTSDLHIFTKSIGSIGIKVTYSFVNMARLVKKRSKTLDKMSDVCDTTGVVDADVVG
jgi:hypothetical protein